jgi:hypothetical protein
MTDGPVTITLGPWAPSFQSVCCILIGRLFTSYFESCNSGYGTISLGLYSAINMNSSHNFGNEILAMQ